MKNVKIVTVLLIISTLFACSLGTTQLISIPIDADAIFTKARASILIAPTDELTLVATLTDHIGNVQTKELTNLVGETGVTNKTLAFDNVIVGTTVNIDIKIYKDDRPIFGANKDILIDADITKSTIKFDEIPLTPWPITDFVTIEGSTINKKIADSVVFIEGRTVTIANFYMSKHEVTQAEYKVVMGTNPSVYDSSLNNPVENVSWYDTLVYCNKRSVKDGLDPCYALFIDGADVTDTDKWGKVPVSTTDLWNNVKCDFTKNGYRLPTEAEWEYAARGGKTGIEKTQTKYAGSNSIGDVAWYAGNTIRTPHEVETKNANSLGIYDLSGNVNEWCWDKYGEIKTDTPIDGPTSGRNHVRRGGSWSSDADYVTIAKHKEALTTSRAGYNGFRVVCTKN